MFEEQMRLETEEKMLSHVERSWGSVARAARTGKLLQFSVRYPLATLLIVLAMLALFAPGTSRAQQNWYYHTIHSSSLALQYGRTAKLSYTNQLSRTRQFKLSLCYIFDEFDSGEDHIKSDIYNLNLEFQYNLMHLGRTFVNGHAGLGGYMLEAKNTIDQKHDETKFSFVGGFQGEFFLQKGALAVVADYDVLYTPWSDVYQFLHLPRFGLAWTF